MLHKNSYEIFLSKNIKKTYPEKCSYCNFCDWSEQCNNEWIEKRDVNQVLGNNRKDCQKFRKSGIKTYDDIAKLDPKKTIEGLREEIKIKRIEQAKLHLEAEKEGVPKFKYIKENFILNKGFNLLPEPTNQDLFFDLEGVQDYIFPGRLEYLFGIFYIEDGKEIFKPFGHTIKTKRKKVLFNFSNLQKLILKNILKQKFIIMHHMKLMH